MEHFFLTKIHGIFQDSAREVTEDAQQALVISIENAVILINRLDYPFNTDKLSAMKD